MEIVFFEQFLTYAVTGRQIYYIPVQAQIINDMNNGSLDSYLVNSQMATNKVRVKRKKILSTASL